MKQIAVVTVLSLGGILAWQLAYRLSSDALAMAIGLAGGALLCVGPLLLVLVGRQRQPLRREDTRVVHITYNDNRQLTIQAVVNPQWPTMPLLADRQREIQRSTAIVRR